MKSPFSFAMPTKRLIAIAGLTLLLAPAARAQVKQPDGTVMPQPANPAEVTEMMSRGFPANSVTLPGLFMYNEINGAIRPSIGSTTHTPRRGHSPRNVV